MQLSLMRNNNKKNLQQPYISQFKNSGYSSLSVRLTSVIFICTLTYDSTCMLKKEQQRGEFDQSNYRHVWKYNNAQLIYNN